MRHGRFLDGIGSVPGSGAHGLEEEPDPLLIVAAVAYLAHSVVVLDLVLLKKVGYTDDRFAKELLFHQIQEDEQPANSAVAVKKRMYRLELIMNQRHPDQRVIQRTLVDITSSADIAIMSFTFGGRYRASFFT